MTDFYAILRGAIDESGAKNDADRATIYLRAWAALEAQFDSPEVALADDVRKVQRERMDEAIKRIEAEFAGAEGAAYEGEADADLFEPDAAEAAPAPQPAAETRPTLAEREESHLRAETRLHRQEELRRGRGGLVALIVVLLVVAAAAGGAYWRWDAIGPLVSGLTGQGGTTAPAGRPDAARPAEQPAMQPARQDAAAPQGGQAEPAAQPAAPTAERPVEQPATQPAGQPAQQSAAREETPPQQPEAQPQQPAEPAEQPAQQAEQPAQPAQQAGGKADRVQAADKDQDRVGGQGQAAERGFLVLEAGEPGKDDLRLPGSSRWSLEGEGQAAALNIDVQIPQRGETLRLTMRANRDETLPASHTIDLIHQGAEKDGKLMQVSGIMAIVDSIETAMPLRAAGALVVPDQFLLALRGSPEDRAENRSRLTGAKWLAVRSVFEDGKNAVFVIEVGNSGGQALKDAFAAWEAQ